MNWRRFIPMFLLSKKRPPKKLVCQCCGRGLHRHDRFVILAAQHKSCTDPKLTGQMPLIEAGHE